MFDMLSPMGSNSKDLSKWINQFISDVNTALINFHKRDSAVTFEQVEQALIIVLELDNVNGLIYLDLPPSRIVELLEEFDFSALRPEVLCEVEFEESLIPAGIPRRLTERRVRLRGEIWTVHKNDADPFPSNPHAHNYNEGITIHLGDGRLFRGRKEIGKLREKTFLELRSAITTVQLPELAL